MRTMLCLCLTGLLLTGCKKAMDVSVKPDEKPSILPVNPNSSGSGPIQAVRKAVARTVTQNDMNSLKTYYQFTFTETGTPPTARQVEQELKTDPNARKLLPLITDGDIVLVANPSRDGIWAHVKDAPNKGGLVLTSAGVENLTAQQVAQRLR
jgi:hypothetical protein